MFGFGKKKLFEQHQRQLYQCLQFGEFALEVAKENADSDQIEFWTSKIGRLRRLTSSSLRNEGILDKNDATFALASPSAICPVHICLHVGQYCHMSSFVSCAAFATHATCPKPEPPRQAQPPCSRRCCELPSGPPHGSRQMKHVLASSSAAAGAAVALLENGIQALSRLRAQIELQAAVATLDGQRPTKDRENIRPLLPPLKNARANDVQPQLIDAADQLLQTVEAEAALLEQSDLCAAMVMVEPAETDPPEPALPPPASSAALAPPAGT